VYLDSSALVKLVLDEPESATFRAVASTWPAWVTSVITQIEFRRVLARASSMSGEAADEASEEALRGATIVSLPPGVIASASSVRPASLRTLDAIQLGTALHLADGIDAFCTYDRRLGAAAEAAGLTVLAPR
jgi:uncharacterized protein